MSTGLRGGFLGAPASTAGFVKLADNLKAIMVAHRAREHLVSITHPITVQFLFSLPREAFFPNQRSNNRSPVGRKPTYRGASIWFLRAGRERFFLFHRACQ